MKAIDHIDKLLDDVEGADLATRYRTGYGPIYVDVVVAPFKKLMPWFAKNGFALVPPVYGVPSKFAWMHQGDNVLATIQPAFGGQVNTDFPSGWPQKITALVEAGFLDMGSKAVKRRLSKHRKKNPGRYHSHSTFSDWMRDVNSILLKSIDLGSWHLTRQPYKRWYIEGMRPSTAANIVMDGFATGEVNRRYRRNRA